MIADVRNNEKPNKIGNELFIRGRKVILVLFLSHNHVLKNQNMLD